MGHDAPLLDNASAPPLAMGVPAAAGTGYAPPQLVAVAGHHQHQQQPPPMLQPPPPQQAAGNTTTATTTVVYAAAAAPPPTLTSAPAVPRLLACPVCGTVGSTVVKRESGACAWLGCVALFWLCPLLCLTPFCCDCAKDIVHRCGGCGTEVARVRPC